MTDPKPPERVWVRLWDRSVHHAPSVGAISYVPEAALDEALDVLEPLKGFAEEMLEDYACDAQEGGEYNREGAAKWNAVVAFLAKHERKP